MCICTCFLVCTNIQKYKRYAAIMYLPASQKLVRMYYKHLCVHALPTKKKIGFSFHFLEGIILTKFILKFGQFNVKWGNFCTLCKKLPHFTLNMCVHYARIIVLLSSELIGQILVYLVLFYIVFLLPFSYLLTPWSIFRS